MADAKVGASVTPLSARALRVASVERGFSSSRIVMSVLPMAVPSRSAATVTVRLRSAVSFPVAVTVTSTELSPVRRTTWWPAVFGSASPGFTL